MPRDARPRNRRAVRPIAWVGMGIGRAGKGVWRAVRGRKDRIGRSMAPLASITGTLMESHVNSQTEDQSDWASSSRAEDTLLQLQLPNLSQLQLQLPPWLTALLPAAPAALATAAGGPANSSYSSIGTSWRTAPATAAMPSSSSSSGSSCGVALSSRQQLHIAAAAAPGVTSSSTTSSSSSSSVQFLGEMLNTNNTFPMVLHPVASGSSSSSSAAQQQQQQQQADHHATSKRQQQQQQQQQLLTVGCRHWGNWWDGRGLLRVKIYDFAIYVDGQQAQSFLPAALSSSSGGTAAQLMQQQQDSPALLVQSHTTSSSASSTSSSSEQQQDLPSLLKSRSSGVGMSLILKAAREVPLNLLSAEYEKVLTRRLTRAGGDASDSAALTELLSCFSHPERLPAAVRGSSSSSSGTASGSSSSGTASGSSSSGTAAAAAAAAAGGEVDGAAGGSAAAAGGGGSVVRGAMIVFERSGDGLVTARVGPHVLGSVHSPKLAEALFDLYLGDQPVSKSAKDAAAKTLNRMSISAAAAATAGSRGSSAAEQGFGTGGDRRDQQQQQQQQQQQPYYLPQSKSELIKCEGVTAEIQASGRKAAGKGFGGGLGLGVSDLAACVLHMGN